MKVNVCVNGSFRYPQYIRWYAASGALGDFHYAHRRSTTAESLGLPQAAAHNGFAKEYALQAAWRALPGAAASCADWPCATFGNAGWSVTGGIAIPSRR